MSGKYNFGYDMSGTIFSKNYFCNSYVYCIPITKVQEVTIYQEVTLSNIMGIVSCVPRTRMPPSRNNNTSKASFVISIHSLDPTPL